MATPAAAYTTTDYRPYDPSWRASHGYPPLAPGQNGFETTPGAVTKNWVPADAGSPTLIGGGSTGLMAGEQGSPSLNRDRFVRPLVEPDAGGPPPVWGSPEWNATNDPQHARDVAYLQSPEWQRYVDANNRSEISTSLNPNTTTDGLTALSVILGGATLGGVLGAGEEGVAGIGEGSVSTAATGVSPAATQGFVGGEVGGGLAGTTTGAASDVLGNMGVDQYGNPIQGNFQGGPGTPGSGDFFNPGGTPGGLPTAPPGATPGGTTIPPGTLSTLQRVFGPGIAGAIGNNPALAAALAAGVLEKSNNPLTQPTIDAIRGAIASGQSIQGMQIPGITPSLQRAIDTSNTNVGAWKPALDQAGAFTSSGGAPITAADTARYMNPYIDQALAPAARKISEAAAAQRMSDAAKAGSRGAFGTERNDQIAALTNRNELMATGDLYGTGYANAFNTALGTAGADKSRALTAGGAFGNIATNTGALGAKDVEGLTGAGGIESLPFTEQLTRDKTAGDVLSGAGRAGAAAIGSTGQPSLLSNLAGATGVLSTLDQLGRPTTPSTPSTPSIPGIGSLPSTTTPSVSTPPSNNPFDDSNSGVFGS